MITAKITQEKHLSRMACIYIRQSTLTQVRFHQESTERQYNLASKAQSFGWSHDKSRFSTATLASPERGRRTARTSKPWSAMWRWAESARSSLWRLPAWRAQPGLASSARVVRHHQYPRDRRGRLLRSGRVQRRPCPGHEGHLRPGRTAHHSRPPLWRQAQQGAEGRVALSVAGRLRPRREQHRARSRPGGPGRRSHRFRVVRKRRDGLRGRAAFQRPWASLSSPLLRGRLGRQAGVGPPDPFPRSRHPGQPVLCWRLCVRTLPIAQAHRAHGRDRHDLARMPQETGASRSPIIIPATSPGTASSPTVIAWRRTGPMARRLPARLAKGFACFRACLFAAVAGGGSASAIRAMAVFIQYIFATGGIAKPSTGMPASRRLLRRLTPPLPSASLWRSRQ